MAGKEREKQGLREAGKLETFYLMMRGGCTFGEREVSLVGEMSNFLAVWQDSLPILKFTKV